MHFENKKPAKLSKAQKQERQQKAAQLAVINEQQYEETENGQAKKRNSQMEYLGYEGKGRAGARSLTPRARKISAGGSDSSSSYRRFIENEDTPSSKNESSLSAWNR